MSGAPKRLHEESVHSVPSKRPLEESSAYPSPSGKLIQPVSNDFHIPFENNQDGRLSKVQRTESRDDKRSSSIHRMPSSSTNFVDHPASADSKLEPKSSKDVRDAKTDDLETKAEVRNVYNDIRMDSQANKVETDVKIDNRDGTEVRVDRRPHVDTKGDTRHEKDNHPATTSYLSWKDNKEHPRGKRHFESPSDGLEPWRTGRPGSQGTDDASKVPPTVEERNSRDTHEAIGENKIDPKGEDKARDKDRKRKDEKHRDFGDRDKDRNDRRMSIQLGTTSKEVQKEDRDAEKWERERKESQKEKESNEGEKDPIKKESSSAADKDCLGFDKVTADGSVKGSEHESTAAETKTLKDDAGKSYDKDYTDRKRERDVDVGDRQEQRSRFNEKESDDGLAEGDTEKDKEIFGGVQQRRRMLRTRGTGQASQREPRFRSKVRDNDGSQDKNEVSAIVYKAGECMQELLKSWKEFESDQDTKNTENLRNGPTLEIRIPAEYVTSTNRQVKGAQLWGTDVYTNDSDLVAVLMHTGYCSPTSSPPPSAIQELRAAVLVLPPQDSYISTLRNNVRSRAWGAGIGCSFRIERCCIVKKCGGTIDLEPRLSHTSAVEPTLAPVSVERTMTTRAAASNALRQQRFVREVTIQYNLCNEPWLKYSISIVADKGLKKSLYTSARLKKGELIYLETHGNRYELCFNGEKVVYNGSNSNSAQPTEGELEKHQNNSHHAQNGDRSSTDQEIHDLFRWSRCKKAMPESVMRSIGIPLPLEYVEVLEENLEWEDVQWSQTGVWVAGKEYPLARVHFLSRN